MRRTRAIWPELGMAAAAAALASCASAPPDGYPGFRVAADGDTVKISSEFPGMDPYPVAQDYCRSRGAQALLLESGPMRWRFRCVGD